MIGAPLAGAPVVLGKPDVDGKPGTCVFKLGSPFNTRGMALEKSSQLDCAKQGTGKEEATTVIKNTIRCFMFKFFYVEIGVVSE